MFAIASDHGGVALKQVVKEFLESRGLAVTDLGTDGDVSVDYPDFGEKLASKISQAEYDEGILICGTGIGMSIVANKFPRVRAALVTDPYMAQMAREHNNANILVLGGRVVDAQKAKAMVTAWLDAKFEGDRHQRRLDKIRDIEKRTIESD
jgi:ribose 5-phosphate isomerase B